jgi:predicted RNase H-like HicB family nuclease
MSETEPFYGISDNAKAIAEQYEVAIRQADGQWYGRCIQLPHVFGDGCTPDACIAQVREAIAVTVEYMLDNGEPLPPPPFKRGKYYAVRDVHHDTWSIETDDHLIANLWCLDEETNERIGLDNAEYNAHLLAAAWEMRTALEAYLWAGSLAETVAASKLAKAAIARAKGGE